LVQNDIYRITLIIQMQSKTPNIYHNRLLTMVFSSTTLLLIGIISVAAPMRAVYADDSSDESQTDQSSQSSSDDSQTDQSSSQTDDSSNRSQTDKSSSDESQSDHSSSSQQCPPGQFPKHNFCITGEQKRKSEELNDNTGVKS
jgi:hypothetical protein